MTPDITRMVDTLVSAWTLFSSRPHSLFRRAPVVVVVILTHAHKRRYPQRPKMETTKAGQYNTTSGLDPSGGDDGE